MSSTIYTLWGDVFYYIIIPSGVGIARCEVALWHPQIYESSPFCEGGEWLGGRERERERRKSLGERGTEALESIRPETDLRNPSQPTDTQNWDSVIVSSVRCTLKREEFAKGNPRIDLTLSFMSALDNINYKSPEITYFECQ